MIQTLIEYVALYPKATIKDKILASMFYAENIEKKQNLFTVDDIRKLLTKARIKNYKKINIANYLRGAGKLVDSPDEINGRKLWRLTKSGETYISDLFQSESANSCQKSEQVYKLKNLIYKLIEPEIKDYFEEAISCSSVGAYRATVVFAWMGAIRILQESIIKKHSLVDINNALTKNDPKHKEIKSINDFSYIQESNQLLMVESLGDIDKNQRSILVDCLNLRNKCGHPGNYKPTKTKMEGFIEDILHIIFNLPY